MPEPTDLSSLAPPEWLADKVLERPDRSHVLNQTIRVNQRWWNGVIEELRLNGGPVSGETVDDDVVAITREFVFKAASGSADSDNGALKLLWHSLAWGSGNKLRLNRRRARSVAAAGAAGRVALRDAARLSHSAPASAYATLRPRGPKPIPFLGGAFASKYLYFVGGGDPDHPCLILDDNVTWTLSERAEWNSLKIDRSQKRTDGNWSPGTYERYCDLARRWAHDLSTPERPVAADEIEYALFTTAATGRKN